VSDHHARRAFELLAQLPRFELETLEIGSAATAHTLLALVEHVGELVEQQQLANVIAAFAGIEAEGHPLEMGCADIHAAIIYLHSHIRDIVNPGTEAP